jgi:nucleotide-binding universal stress UspA family protein
LRKKSIDIRTVLCATDLSESSEKACELAVSIAKRTKGSRLVFVSVVKSVYVAMGDIAYGTEVVIENEEKYAREVEAKLKRMVARAKKLGVSNCEAIVRRGDPHHTLIEIINEVRPDLVVMGNRRPGYKKGIFLGSVSSRVAADSPTSVLIVR